MAGIQDVARRAGVAPSTVSYVLSGRRSISLETRKRVEDAIAELNYRPHAGARSLASAKTQVLGLVSPLRPGVDVNVIMQFVAGVATRARHYNHDVLLVTERDATGIESVSLRSMVDAFLVMDIEAQDPRLETLARLRQPCVLIGLPENPGSLSCIDLDFVAAGAMAVRKLEAAGHTRIALIGSPPEVVKRQTAYAVWLARGAESEAATRGVQLRRIPCDDDPVAAAAIVNDIIDAGEITGLIVHNESALPGVSSALDRRGPSVVDVVAIGPKALVFSQLTPFTVIDIPGVSIGSSAVDMAMDLLNDSPLPQVRLIAPRME
ncbi:MAG: LacI family DNA-binding transcriptional regulator [Arachnia sp.]